MALKSLNFRLKTGLRNARFNGLNRSFSRKFRKMNMARQKEVEEEAAMREELDRLDLYRGENIKHEYAVPYRNTIDFAQGTSRASQLEKKLLKEFDDKKNLINSLVDERKENNYSSARDSVHRITNRYVGLQKSLENEYSLKATKYSL